MAASVINSGWGLTTVEADYNHLKVSSDGQPIWMSGGATIDWSIVPALTFDTRFVGEAYVHKANEKVLPYGTIMVRIATNVATANNVGLYAPYDVGAAGIADGRNTITRDSFILNQTIRQTGFGILNRQDTRHVGGIIGGRVYKERLWLDTPAVYTITYDVNGVLTATAAVIGSGAINGLKVGPTQTIFEAAFARISYAQTNPATYANEGFPINV